MNQRERVVFTSANPRLAALAARGAARVYHLSMGHLSTP